MANFASHPYFAHIHINVCQGARAWWDTGLHAQPSTLGDGLDHWNLGIFGYMKHVLIVLH